MRPVFETFFYHDAGSPKERQKYNRIFGNITKKPGTWKKT